MARAAALSAAAAVAPAAETAEGIKRNKVGVEGRDEIIWGVVAWGVWSRASENGW
jgi:hypothetical protein